MSGGDLETSEATGTDPRERWLAETFGRQRSTLERMQAQAWSADDRTTACTWWLALRRQAQARLNSAWKVAGGYESPIVDGHRRALADFIARAEIELERLDVAERERAETSLGVRVAVVGKGGAGKTLVSSTLARLLARRGRKVLAADLDPNPGLAYGLGVPVTDAGLPPEALEPDDGTWMGQLPASLDPTEAVERFATLGPDRVRYLGLGKITDPDRNNMRRTMGPVFHILLNFGDPAWDVVGDLEAGTNTPYQGYCFFADLVLVVVGPSWKSALTARRLLGLIGDLPHIVIGNRMGDEPDHPGLDARLRIPFDPAVAEADRLGVAVVDHCRDSPAVLAIDRLANSLTTKEVFV